MFWTFSKKGGKKFLRSRVEAGFLLEAKETSSINFYFDRNFRKFKSLAHRNQIFIDCSLRVS